MPRPQKSALKSQVITVQQPTGFVASAANLNMPTMEQRTKLRVEPWQGKAWHWYDTVSEFRYSCDWVGNLLSKAVITVTKDGKATTDKVAVDALDALFGSPEGRAEMLRQLGVHFTVAGEAYVIGAPLPGDEGDDWLVAAAANTTFTEGGQVKVDTETFQEPLAIRLWRPHPLRRNFSNSPARAVLPVLSELNGLTEHVAAQIDSRLAGAGMLLLPSEVTFSAAPAEGEKGDQTTSESAADTLIEEILRTMATAIQDRSAAAALVPMVLQMAGEHIDKVKHLRFWSDLDEHAIELRQEAIRRLALGMDMPPEVLEGSADLNHWSSWQVEEAAIKSHTEPLLAVIVDSLTNGYLIPYLMTIGEMSREDAEAYSFGADTAAMRLRPNRSVEAMELYDRGLLSVEALMRENGFDPTTDMISADERKVWFLRKVASGSTTPELVAAALNTLGILDAVPASDSPELERGQEARPTPSLNDHPDQGPPDMEEINDNLVASSLLIVDRALERAGNRLKAKMGGRSIAGADGAFSMYQHVEVKPNEIDELLIDAWSQAERFAPMLGVDADEYVAVLHRFTHDTIAKGKPVDTDMLRIHLTKLAG